jgi:hypothetical protein
LSERRSAARIGRPHHAARDQCLGPLTPARLLIAENLTDRAKAVSAAFGIKYCQKRAFSTTAKSLLRGKGQAGHSSKDGTHDHRSRVAAKRKQEPTRIRQHFRITPREGQYFEE